MAAYILVIFSLFTNEPNGYCYKIFQIRFETDDVTGSYDAQLVSTSSYTLPFTTVLTFWIDLNKSTLFLFDQWMWVCVWVKSKDEISDVSLSYKKYHLVEKHRLKRIKEIFQLFVYEFSLASACITYFYLFYYRGFHCLYYSVAFGAQKTALLFILCQITTLVLGAMISIKCSYFIKKHRVDISSANFILDCHAELKVLLFNFMS